MKLKRTAVSLIYGLGVFCLACGSSNTHGKNDENTNESEVMTVDFVHVGQGSSDWGPGGEYFGPQFLVFTSMESWMSKKDLFFLRPAKVEDSGMKAVETVDFSRQRVLVFTFGQVGTTGYSIRLDKIDFDDTASFYLTGVSPSADEAVGEAMDHPIDMVLIDRTDLPDSLLFYVNGEATEFEVHVE